MGELRTYTLTEMRAVQQEYAVRGALRAKELVQSNLERIAIHAITAGVDKGLREYGDRTYHRTLEYVDEMALQEADDMAFYGAIAEWIVDGRPNLRG